MVQLTPIELEDVTVIYIETTEDVTAPTGNLDQPTEEEGRMAKGGTLDKRSMMQNFQTIEKTIRAYTTYTLSAFRNLGIANIDIDEVTLQFGIEIGGEAGIPYVTKGTAKSNLNITVKCSFPKNKV